VITDNIGLVPSDNEISMLLPEVFGWSTENVYTFSDPET